MINNLLEANIRIFVFGTLRRGGRLDFYMEGSDHKGMYYTQGQLMKSQLGSAYINFDYKDAYTIGELYMVNFPCLQRIDHLESVSGEFPTGYDLDIIPIWPYNSRKKPDFDPNLRELALFYKRRDTPVKILSGDWVHRTSPIKEIKRYLVGHKNVKISHEDIIKHVVEYLDFEK